MARAIEALPIVLVIEANDEMRALLKRYLFSNGFHMVGHCDVEETRAWMDGKELRPSVLLLFQAKQSLDQLIHLGRQLRQQEGLTSETSVVLIAEQFEAEQEGETMQISEHEYVLYLETGQQLIGLLRALCLPEAASL